MDYVTNAKHIKKLINAINNKDCDVNLVLRSGPGLNHIDSWKVSCDSREAIGDSPENASNILLEKLKSELTEKIIFNENQSNGYKKVLESVTGN